MTDTTMNIRLDNSSTSRMVRDAIGLPWNGLNDTITAHRNPTPYEIRFGYGATHYRDFDVTDWIKPDGTLKKWIKADDGLRYYRG
jgi:hypothetical protein